MLQRHRREKRLAHREAVGKLEKSASPEGATPQHALCRSDITLFHFLGISVIILLRNYLINSLSEGHGFKAVPKAQ